MVTHFGISIKNKSDGLKLTRENFVKVNNKSSFGNGKVYSESYIKKQIEDSLYNYDMNMEYCYSLSKEEFNKELLNFLEKADFFVETTDLTSVNEIPGYYVMVLDEYCQAYVGRAKNIKKRIQTHWSKQKEFDRLVYGSKEKSILSIDSFRAYDTTRIFMYLTADIEGQEDIFINMLDQKYLLNRTKGGRLNGLSEANRYAKKRNKNVQQQIDIPVEDTRISRRTALETKEEPKLSKKSFLKRIFKR